MNRKSFTAILVGGALAGGCSKPNPLFLDTWDVITDSGSVSQTSAVTLETTTIEPPTTTSDPPVTTTSSSTSPSTITSSSDNTTTTTEPNPTTETTGEGFVCDGLDDDMDGCCELTVEVEADTFFSSATDDVNGWCVVTEPPKPLDCDVLSFGELPSGFLAKDDGMTTAVNGVTVMALRFPAKDGQLLSEYGPIPTEHVASVQLAVKAKYSTDLYDDEMQFALHALAESLSWVEAGDGSECVEDMPSFNCRECGPGGMNECAVAWSEEKEPVLGVLELIGVVDAVGVGGMLQALDLKMLMEPQEWLPKIIGGTLVVAPQSAVYNDEFYSELIPPPGIEFYARESGAPAKLIVRVCGS